MPEPVMVPSIEGMRAKTFDPTDFRPNDSVVWEAEVEVMAPGR